MMAADPAIEAALERAGRHSPYLRGLIRREPALVELIRSAGPGPALDEAFRRLDAAHPAAALRSSKAAAALAIAIGDLSGLCPLEQVTAALTDHAGRALAFAMAAAFSERDAAPAGFVALALGKMGSGELNYSSDIDLIFLHDPDRLPLRPGEDPTEIAVRLVRRISTLLSERTVDGYCWRVDLRLRPDPSATPSSLPIMAAEQYYQSQALAWERSAFIRARPAAGDIAMGQDFLRAIEPFLWRRSLDYSALDDIREVSHRIRDHYAERQTFGPGYDLKRGRGGIREVEFHAQILQLIFGGREPALRPPATLDALRALAAAGRLPDGDAAFLAAAYRRFRTVEHRFQMIGDQQTHRVPTQKTEREAVALLDGRTGWKEVESELLPMVRGVARLYDRLLASSAEERRGPRIPPDTDSLLLWARRQRIADPQLLATMAEGWRAGRPRSLRALEARLAFETVAPALVAEVGSGRHGREGLLRLDRMIAALPSGVQFWRLLAANRPLLDVVARLLTTTPYLSDALAARPDLIDVLLEPAAPLPDVAAARAELAMLTASLSGEPLLDRVRRWTAERRFQLGVALLDGRVEPLEAGRTFARMAEATVERLAAAVEADFAVRHGHVPDSRLVVLALGRFGGGELTAQSDLDLVLTFTGPFDTRSDGAQPLPASVWYNRLGQRLIAALTVPTAAGPLYEVDTRLRPSGADGLLVVSLDSFAQYQRTSAEVWETMALTRARPITGSEHDRGAARQLIDAILSAPRDGAVVTREAVAMRRHMAHHKPPAGPFDVKLMKGGLVDIEFIIQARALTLGRPVPAAASAAAAAVAPELVAPLELMMRILILNRLIHPHDHAALPGPAAGAAIAKACGYPNFATLRSALAAARKTVNAAWKQSFGSI
jgi:glutamate-ammonia-ligase adenylyltransferase